MAEPHLNNSLDFFMSPFSFNSLSQKPCRLLEMPYTPFSFRNIRTYKPTLVWLSISFLFALCCVLPFYAQWVFELCGVVDIPPFLATLFGFLSIASVLFTPANRRFSTGFFIGILWFYWVSLGMRYFDMGWFIPIVVILVGIFIGFVFYVGLWCECLIVRFVFLLILSYLTPLGFDWIILESVFAYSYIGVDKLSFAFVILALWLLVKYQSWWKLLGIVCLILALDFRTFAHTSLQPYQMQGISTQIPQLYPEMPLKIKLIQSEVNQDIKYRIEQIHNIFEMYMQEVEQAINEGYDVIVLPESAFYVPIDVSNFTGFAPFERFMDLSEDIVILSGALREQFDRDTGEQLYFNSMFKFENGKVSYYDKVLLVPFGEYLPSVLLPLVNLFFEGIGGFSSGEKFGYFDIKGVRFKNAICYEGTHREFYKDNPQYVIMISNNAWFVPSIEPILQKNLMKYYARIHKSTIFHATNRSHSAIITP